MGFIMKYLIKNKILFLVLNLFFILSFPLFSQNIEADADSVFFINSFNFEVDGITRNYVLINTANLIYGEELIGITALEEYIQEKKQLLINQRTLESVEIEYTIGQMREDGKYPVDLIIYVKDTWNLIALPYPKYDSNNGFEISIKLRDYNFLGTMQPLSIDLGYRYDNLGRSYYDALLNTSIPFIAFGLSWSVFFENYFTYQPDLPEPVFYQNVTGISADIPIGSTTLRLGFQESIKINDEVYSNFFQPLYLTSRPFA